MNGRISHHRRRFGIGLIGGPTAVIDYGGLRSITDPTFDRPREYEYLVKTKGPAVDPSELGDIDLVLLSHDEHVDNFDEQGRHVAAAANVILTGPISAARLGPGAMGLEPWTSTTVPSPDGNDVVIEAVPAVHGPADAPRDAHGHINCEVTGFIVSSAQDLPTLYVSGDNASIGVVAEVAGQRQIDIAILFAGAARVPAKFSGRPLTLTSERAADAAALLGATAVIPVHCDGWGHFAEGPLRVGQAFDEAGLSDLLVQPELGTWLPMHWGEGSETR